MSVEKQHGSQQTPPDRGARRAQDEVAARRVPEEVLSPKGVLQQLHKAYALKAQGGHEFIVARDHAIRDALILANALTPEYLAYESDINLVAYAPVHDGKLAREGKYMVFALFPKANFPTRHVFLASRGGSLAQGMKNDTHRLDTFVNTIDVRDEGDVFLQKRILLELGLVDNVLKKSDISDQQQATFLKKQYHYLRRYLEVSDRLSTTFSLPKLFNLIDTHEDKTTLSMMQPQVDNLIKVLKKKSVTLRLKPTLTPHSITLDIADLRMRAEIFPRDPHVDLEQVPEDIKDAYEICKILEIGEREVNK